MNRITRRDMLSLSGALLGAAVSGFPEKVLSVAANFQSSPKLKIIIAGAHPDDPESGCGGTIARLSDSGHEVVVLYLTRGEAGIQDKSYEEAAKIRTTEAMEACRILKARPLFAGQIDGNTEVNKEQYAKILNIFEAEKPDVAFTHWPIDTHRDHRANSVLVYDAWLRMKKSFILYYFEVMSGRQTQQFYPTHYVDITATEARKREACMIHKSQNPEEFYADHDEMNRFRGMEYRFKYAEAFIWHEQNNRGFLPLGQLQL